jgi:hypothetical protein
VALVEGLGLIEPVAILSSNLVSVKVLLGLPSGTVEEIHGSVETAGCHCGLTSLGWLHRIIEIDATLVRDFLTQVVAWLESGVGEGLSGCGSHFVIPDARMCHWESSLSVTIVDRMHGIVILWNA